MPQCAQCENKQGKLNPGDLCKSCFKVPDKIIDSDMSITEVNEVMDRRLTEIIKDFMLQDERRQLEYVAELKDSMSMLKDEITRKNFIIDEQLSIIKSFTQQKNISEKHIETKADSTIHFNNDNQLNNEHRLQDHQLHSNPQTSSQTNTNNDFMQSRNPEVNNDCYYSNVEKDDVNVSRSQSYGWVNVRNKTSRSKNIKSTSKVNMGIESYNPFAPLQFYTNYNEQEEVDTVVSDGEREREDDHRSFNHETIPIINKTRPQVVINEFPERDIIRQPTRPGISSYTDAVRDGKRTVIFSSSMTKGIRVKRFSSCLDNGIAHFWRFHGAKAKHVKQHVSIHLDEEHPDRVIILAGGNDLPTKRDNPTPVETIAQEIIDTDLYVLNTVLKLFLFPALSQDDLCIW